MEKRLNKRGLQDPRLYKLLMENGGTILLDVSNTNIFSSKVSQLFRFSLTICYFITVFLKARTQQEVGTLFCSICGQQRNLQKWYSMKTFEDA